MTTRFICLVVFLVTMWTDWRRRVIPNWVIVLGLIAGLIVNFQLKSVIGVGISVIHGFIMASSFFLLYLAGGVGAGDVKLIFLTGVLIPFPESWYIVAWGCILTGVHVLCLSVRSQSVRKIIVETARLVFFSPALLSSKRMARKKTAVGTQERAVTVPLGCWISCAGLVVLIRGLV